MKTLIKMTEIYFKLLKLNVTATNKATEKNENMISRIRIGRYTVQHNNRRETDYFITHAIC